MIILQYILSIIFIVTMYVLMFIVGLLGAIPALFSRKFTYQVIKFYCGAVIYLLRVLCGLKVEIRGEIPKGSVVVASKHQSFLDIILHAYYLEHVNFVMKQELRYVPILGFYAARIGAAPVKRGDKSKAVSQMVSGVQKQGGDSQLVIYPQGTRVPPGKKMPYKVGAAVLCQRMERPCVMAATNVGMLWPKHSLLRKRGTVVIEYLGTVPEGLALSDFVSYLEEHIETASDRLMSEAGFEQGS